MRLIRIPFFLPCTWIKRPFHPTIPTDRNTRVPDDQRTIWWWMELIRKPNWKVDANEMRSVIKVPVMRNHWLDRDLIIYYMDQERKCINSAVPLITPTYRSAPISVRLYKGVWTKGGLRGSVIRVILVSQTRWNPTFISTYLTNTFSLGIIPLPNWIV